MPELTLQQAMDLAFQLYNAGQLADAEQVCRQILGAAPNHGPALHLLGVLDYRKGHLRGAIDLIGRAIAAHPTDPEYHRNLGLMLMQAGDVSAAVTSCREAVRLKPDDAIGWLNLGVVLQQQGEVAGAADAFRTAIRHQPRMAQAHGNLGSVLAKQDRYAESEAAHREAVRLHPANATFHLNLGEVLRLQHRPDEAIASYQAALERDPNLVAALKNWANILRERGELDAAIDLYRRALAVAPRDHVLHNNLGTLLKDVGRLDESLATFRRAAELTTDDPIPLENLIYSMHFAPGSDAATIGVEQARWAQRFAAPLRGAVTPHSNDRNPDRRLRVGYVSPNFHDHAESFFVLPLLEAHDRDAVEVHAYYTGASGDAVTQRIRAAVAHWNDLPRTSDAALAEKIRADGIDILIDLTMHMAGSRLLAFARKPAPVQMTWLAYPGATGLDAIDYRITDAFMDPPQPGDDRRFERPLRLPDSWVAYHPVTDTPPVGPLPASQNGFVTFGSLNNFCKANDVVLALWGPVMCATPGARLLMLAPQGKHREHVLSVLGSQGVSADRIEFIAPQPRYDYLETYHRIDVSLDPFPYNGITTTCDALWMGVPVLSLVGSPDRPASRAGLSLLSAAGLPELACGDEEHFVYRAATLARDFPRLAVLRASLRDRVHDSPLMDGLGFAQNMEAAYRAAWRQWCATAP